MRRALVSLCSWSAGPCTTDGKEAQRAEGRGLRHESSGRIFGADEVKALD